jgi:hypothetical protein
VGHPFIHLAYAYEFQCKEVAAQALSLGCTDYDELHKLLDQPFPDNSTYKSSSLAGVIKQVQDDMRFDGLLTNPGFANVEIVLNKRLDVITEHWNAWIAKDPVQQLEQCCDLAVLLAISTGGPDRSFDFFCAHIMTVAHALRVLWHFIPPERRASILRQYALLTVLIYTVQLRPSFSLETIELVPLSGRDWNWVIEHSLNHKWALDSHFLKVVRAAKAFAETFGEKDDFYLKGAIKFMTEFKGWGGFGYGV